MDVDHACVAEFVLPSLSQSQFTKISRLVHELCGICLPPGKEGLVKTRLTKRLRGLGLRTFDAYLDYLAQEPAELRTMVDCITTNKTGFFREPHHFDFLRSEVFPQCRKRTGRVRIWSAGCSSGEEPYSIAILAREELLRNHFCDLRILGTDISSRMLTKAREAAYDDEALKDVPPAWRQAHFTVLRAKPPRTYRLNSEIRELVRLARLNLMEPWPMKGPFDVIFCRNVMIYFDKPTQQELVRRFRDMLVLGGYLMVGHSESLTAFAHSFQYVQPAVYSK